MTTGSAIMSGLRAAAQKKWMVLIFYGCNLLLAAAVAAPMYAAMREHVGNSMVGTELARGFSAPWLNEFQIAYADFLHAFSIHIAYMGIVFLALNTVLSAGAFEVFAREGAGLHAFGRGIGKYFSRFARIALAASVLYFAVFWFWNGPADRLVDRIFRDSTREFWHFYLNLLRVGLLVFCAVVVNTVVEYVRADVVRDQHASVLAAFGHGAGFVFARLGRVLTIYVGVGLFAVASVVVYSVFAHYFPQTNVPTVFVWFIVAQALIWCRWMFRLASWAAATAYYNAPAAEPVRAAAPLATTAATP